MPFSIGSVPFVCGLSSGPSFPEVFFVGRVLPFDDVALVGTGLSLLELELWEFDRGSSPFVDDEVSLLDLRFRLSPGMVEKPKSLADKHRAANATPQLECRVIANLPLYGIDRGEDIWCGGGSHKKDTDAGGSCQRLHLMIAGKGSGGGEAQTTAPQNRLITSTSVKHSV